MKYIIALGITAAVVTGALFVALFSQNDAPEAQSEQSAVEQTTEAAEQAESFSGTATLAELQARGESLECAITVDSAEAENEVTGTYFVHDGEIRGDFIVPSEQFEEPVVSSVIITDDMFYSWSEISGEMYGIQMSLEGDENDEIVGSNEPVARDEMVDYSCTVWTNIDKSIFEPPSTVLFRDPSMLMQEGMEYGTIYEEGEF